ncbi:hypothetical protein BJX70DRAFT_10371 [Aspergillus crustosus]
MSKATPGGHNGPPGPKVVISTRRKLGWWELSPDEPSGPTQDVGRSDILQSHILPPDRKRQLPDRIQPESASGDNPTGKRMATALNSKQQGKKQPGRGQLNSGAALSETEVGKSQCSREVLRLRLENDLRALSESQQIQTLQVEVERLNNLNDELNRTVHRFVSDAEAPEPTVAASGQDNILKDKGQEIETHVSTIKHLESTLSSVYEHDILRSRMQKKDLYPSVVNIEEAMTSTKLGIIRVADLLANCLQPPRQTLSALRNHPELRDLVKGTIREHNVLHSSPDLALRALLFRLLYDNILHSDIWTGLHVEGFMLRAYHKIIQQTAGAEFAETFHKAALLHMIDHDPEFKTCFLGACTQELENHTLTLLSPLLDLEKLSVFKKDISRVMRRLLDQAFSFRVRCLAPDGVRYEILHFQPQDLFNPDMMEIEDALGNESPEAAKSKATGSQRRIKLCVHGAVVAHTHQKQTPPGLQGLKDISQPFLRSEHHGRYGKTTGELVSGKAIVVLN